MSLAVFLNLSNCRFKRDGFFVGISTKLQAQFGERTIPKPLISHAAVPRVIDVKLVYICPTNLFASGLIHHIIGPWSACGAAKRVDSTPYLILSLLTCRSEESSRR